MFHKFSAAFILGNSSIQRQRPVHDDSQTIDVGGTRNMRPIPMVALITFHKHHLLFEFEILSVGFAKARD
jgi:hypothetical protein